jgi:hypothetical protein
LAKSGGVCQCLANGLPGTLSDFAKVWQKGAVFAKGWQMQDSGKTS